MASAFLRGLKDLAGMTRTTGRVTGSLLSAPLREGNAIGAFARANPARSSIMGLGGALAIGGAGLAGLGPGSFIGDETARYITSKYADTEESQNLIKQTKLFGGTAAAAGLGFIGAGALMKEPTGGSLLDFATRAASKTGSAIAKSSSKIKDALIRSIPNAPDKFLDLSMKTVDTAMGYVTGSASKLSKTIKSAPSYTKGFTQGIFAKPDEVKNLLSRREATLKSTAAKGDYGKAGRGARKRQEFKRLMLEDAYSTGVKHSQAGFRYAKAGTRYAQKKIGSPVSFAKKHPFMTATAAGFTAGAVTAVGTAELERNAMGGFEGNIIDMGASSGGSISPELQFSTQGLVFALHKNNKNSRSRYQ